MAGTYPRRRFPRGIQRPDYPCVSLIRRRQDVAKPEPNFVTITGPRVAWRHRAYSPGIGVANRSDIAIRQLPGIPHATLQGATPPGHVSGTSTPSGASGKGALRALAFEACGPSMAKVEGSRGPRYLSGPLPGERAAWGLQRISDGRCWYLGVASFFRKWSCT
jgi:hypothetical protein